MYFSRKVTHRDILSGVSTNMSGVVGVSRALCFVLFQRDGWYSQYSHVSTKKKSTPARLPATEEGSHKCGESERDRECGVHWNGRCERTQTCAHGWSTSHLAPRPWFLNTVLHPKEPGFLGGLADSRTRAGKAVTEPGSLCCANEERKAQRMTEDMSKGHRILEGVPTSQI